VSEIQAEEIDQVIDAIEEHPRHSRKKATTKADVKAQSSRERARAIVLERLKNR
jgi:hypothetical protein